MILIFPFKNVQQKLIKIQLSQKPPTQPSAKLSGKYYRTRSLSQNLQQIFHPNRQSHSRSINNLSNVGGKSLPGKNLNIPGSLPQSPCIMVESVPFFPSLNIPQPTLNFAPPAVPIFPFFNFNQKVNEPPTKQKVFNLGEFRKNQYMRSSSMEAPQIPQKLQKRPSWDERKKPLEQRFQINDVVRENVELLRKYSDPKIQFNYHHDTASSSLSMLQNAFKAKLASLFKNKKKYTIAEPSSSSGKETNENFALHRCESCQSLPMLFSKKKQKKKEKKSLRQMKKSSIDRCRADAGNLNLLNLNPPQIIGGSFDNLLLINRMDKKRTMMGTYDTYHGRPLMSHASRLKALYKYRKPSESDDATTLSFDYDSGDMSDTSSLARSSSDVEEDSSSFSDLTTKSSSRGYNIRSSTSINSMPLIKLSRKSRQSKTAAQSPNRSLETPQFPTNFRAAPQQYPNLPKSHPYNLTHQMSAPALYNSLMQSQSSSFVQPQFAKPNYFPSLSIPAANNVSQNQMIKAFFTSGPASSNDFPLVSFPTHTSMNWLKKTHLHHLHPHAHNRSWWKQNNSWIKLGKKSQEVSVRRVLLTSCVVKSLSQICTCPLSTFEKTHKMWWMFKG